MLIFKQIEKLKTPFIIFTAQNETVVNPKSTEKFMKKAYKLNKDCKLINIENAQHELFMEKDKPRAEVLSEILEFFGD